MQNLCIQTPLSTSTEITSIGSNSCTRLEHDKNTETHLPLCVCLSKSQPVSSGPAVGLGMQAEAGLPVSPLPHPALFSSFPSFLLSLRIIGKIQ